MSRRRRGRSSRESALSVVDAGHVVAWWELAVGGAAVTASVVAVWVTLTADFLAEPGWLAAQKADFILGPAFVGLYWLRVRPQSRFGPLLIGFGLVGAVYILQSSSNPWLFGFGVNWEAVVYLGNLTLILTFPTGRLDGLAAKLILLAAVVLVVVPLEVGLALVPTLGPDGSISGCSAACPHNALTIASGSQLAADIYQYRRIATVAVGFATAGLLVWRMVRGTPPQRRAVAIGAPVALVFTTLQVAYQFLKLVAPDSAALHSVVEWGLAGARSLIWYGFLAGLIAAQLFAGRALRRLVYQSLRRPSKSELEAVLREPLGDPDLRLVFEHADGVTPEPSRAVTVVERAGQPAVAIIHDPQLRDDPELLQAAGAVALLAAENAELDAAWNDALDELRESRVRIVTAADTERRKLERDLHDGVQQRLVALRIKLTLAAETAADSTTRARIQQLDEHVEEAVKDLREVAHGLYPPVLSQLGLLAAVQQAAQRSYVPIEISATGVARLAAEVESAVYYCCLESLQNAIKHAGPSVRISISLRMDQEHLVFQVADDGSGFDPSSADGGAGLQNMRDRLGALHGRLSIVSSPGHGTMVSGSIPIRQRDGRQRPRTDKPSAAPA
jgi:signal transduction histidine kinase